MQANGATFVYTPQVLVQGHDAPSWRGGVSDLLSATRKRPARARVTLAAASDPGGDFSVRARRRRFPIRRCARTPRCG